MFVSIEQLNKTYSGIEAIVDRCCEEKWIRVMEKENKRYVSKADAYKLRFILLLVNTGIAWEDIPQYLTPGYLYSVESPGG